MVNGLGIHNLFVHCYIIIGTGMQQMLKLCCSGTGKYHNP